MICTHLRLRRVLGSLSMIDLEKGEIDSETETEVDFTHFRSRSVFRSSSIINLEKGNTHLETEK